ncbi:NUDIX domain-containing protein [Frankia sp. CNm7]|uniref:NUDIX domain-containing protein n=1 Tax=Frankia nepalensis TaxID=1836974 RepID=A0A937UQS1_9ACTN|nr:NUDIX domain-containing protein [Frankia nepalensis]MBL7497933.1 NUDIX domain-containing protein [Frankia nepalensis]MBL7510888.1 NUDIX domain-containing protein [Frankia nepalensis]MBL7522250.1 NUDIX domain-containing protein [Frankia nepalensis]MBL7630388.1 NUDIX domain-containing protein [Frankia nepalensis]
MHSVSVAGVVRREDGRVLCIRRRDDGSWQIPGGVLEDREHIPDGLRREVAEETGLAVEPIRLTGVYLNVVRGVVALVFLCRPAGGSGEPSEQTDESAEVCWLTLAEVEERSVPAFAVRVRDACAGVAEPAIRSHDGIDLIGAGIGAQVPGQAIS